MKKRIRNLNHVGKTAHRTVMFVERADGTWNVFEDDERELRKYRAKRGERTSIHRAFVRTP